MMYENGVLSNYRRSWFLYRLVLNVILLGCFLLNFEGAEGQVQVSILNDTLDFFGDRSELNVFIDSTLTFRVIWRNSSWDEPNRPTDPSSILIQNLNGAVTCPVTGDCGRFDMNSEYGLVLNGVIIEDGNQTLWCDVSAGDGNGFDSIVPVVAGWRNHDSDSSVTYDLNNNMLHCTVYNFLPDDNFTLTWMDPEGEVLVSTTKASIYEDIYFSATLSAEPSKSGKKYTCVAEGKAFTFDAFSKEIYVPDCDEDGDCDNTRQRCYNKTVCICRQGYVFEQGNCIEIDAYKLQWQVNKQYVDKLANRDSEIFKAEASIQCDAVGITCRGINDYKGCSVLRFSPGSIVTEFQIFLDVDTSLTPQVIQTDYVQPAIDNGELSGVLVIVGPVSITELNECEEGLHECSEHADCMDTGSGYDCQCKKGYTDVNGAKPGFYCDKVPASRGLSSGTVAGIVIGVILVIVLVGVAAFVLLKRGNSKATGKVCTVCEECGIECCEESCDCNTLCDEPIIPVRPIVIICIVILCAVILMSGGIIIFKAIKASNSTVNVSEQDGKQWVKASEVTKGVFLKWKLSNDKTNCFKVEKQEHKLWRACDKIRPTDTECTIKIPDGKNYLFKVTAVQKCASKNSLHKENEETHKKSEQEDTPVHTTSKEPQQEENPICIIFLVQDFTVRYNTLFISWNSTLSDNFQMKHVKVDYEKQVQGTSPYQRTPENAESIQLMERDLEHLFRVTTVYSNCREKDMDNVRSGKSEEKDFPRTEKKLTIIAHTATPEQVGQASANTAIPQDGRPEPQDQDSANKATPRDDRPELPDLASADKVTLQDDQKDQASKVTELYIKLQLPNDEYNKCIEVETQEYETSTWEPCDNIKDTECHIKLNGKQKYLFKVTAEESVTEKQIC